MGFLDLFRQQPNQPMQAQQPQQGGVFSGRLGGLNDPYVALPLAAALMQPGDIGSNLGQGFAMAGQGMDARRKLQQERAMENATAKYLEAQGADAGLVELAKSGAGAQALQQWSAMRKDPLDDIRLKTAQLQYEKLASPAADDTEYGLTPQTGVDENGNPVLIQLGKNGRSIRTPLPDGVTISKTPIKLDAGTEFILLDPITRQPVGRIPKDVAGAASQRVQGEAQGTAQYSLPSAKLSVDTAIQQAEQLQSDPYLPSMVGPVASRLPNTSADAARVQGKMDQLGGSAFLQARQALKGGGAITDMEGQKAEAALVRANAAQKVEDYKAAIEEYKTHLRNGFAILEQQARGGGQPSPQGGVVDYTDFFGGQ